MGDFSKNVSVISNTDLERIRRTVGGLSVSEEDNIRRNAERDQGKARCNARMVKWGTTADAVR
jgi:hypothetical protein